ncbi:MAG: SAM-dependent methyltransferase [Alphaproteobacteria bacterium]|nr:SAM-dependent methyltransferase [Alphaproteobacteria bacterium]
MFNGIDGTLIGFFTALALFAAVAGSILWFTVRTGSSPTPSGPALRRAILAAVAEAEANAPPGPIIEIGGGWGGLARALHHRFPHRPVVVFEPSWAPYWVSRLLSPRSAANRPRFKNRAVRSEDLAAGAVAVAYLAPETMKRLAPLFHALPPGAAVVSAMFAIPGWTPGMTLTADDLYKSPVYLYRT